MLWKANKIYCIHNRWFICCLFWAIPFDRQCHSIKYERIWGAKIVQHLSVGSWFLKSAWNNFDQIECFHFDLFPSHWLDIFDFFFRLHTEAKLVTFVTFFWKPIYCQDQIFNSWPSPPQYSICYVYTRLSQINNIKRTLWWIEKNLANKLYSYLQMLPSICFTSHQNLFPLQMIKKSWLDFFFLLKNVLLPTSGKSHLKFGDYCIMNVGIRAKGDFGSMNWTDVLRMLYMGFMKIRNIL